MAKYNKHITKKLEQSDVDDWMCEQLNKIINHYFDGTTRLTAGNAFVEMEHVMRLANRRKEPGDKYDLYFSDRSRSDYKFNPYKFNPAETAEG